jgi:hypothetical protein
MENRVFWSMAFAIRQMTGSSIYRFPFVIFHLNECGLLDPVAIARGTDMSCKWKMKNLKWKMENPASPSNIEPDLLLISRADRA